MSRSWLASLALAAIVATSGPAARATGLVTCDSGPPDGWQPQEKLTAMLTEKRWDIRRIKVDGGCYEVYALDDRGERVEAYFHPVTLERVPVPGQ